MIPEVPLTVEGASVLHQMMRLRRGAWRGLNPESRRSILEETIAALSALEAHDDGRQSAVFSLLGHKGDLLFLHFRKTLEELVFSSLCANVDKYSAIYENFNRHGQWKNILIEIGKINENGRGRRLALDALCDSAKDRIQNS